MKKKRIAGYAALSVLAVIGVVALYIYKEYNRTQKDTSKLEVDYTLTATDLVSEFIAGSKSSETKYWDKVLRVSGMVKKIDRSERAWQTIMLGDTATMSSIRCTIDSIHTMETEGIRDGDKITLTGICSGFDEDELLGSDVLLVRCIINSKK